MRSLRRLGFLFWLGGALASAASAAIWVAPNGDDHNPGSEDRPVRTLAGARNLVRTVNQAMTDDITVFIAAGTYRLDEPLLFGPEDSGTGGYNVVYTAASDERPIISGAVAVMGWKLADAARHLWVAPAPAALKDTRQLYVNGVRAPRTRGRLPVALTETPTGYAASADVLAHWRNPSAIEFIYTGGDSIWSERSAGLDPWTEPRCPVAAIAGTAITMVQPAWSNVTKRVRYDAADPKLRRPANPVAPAGAGKEPTAVENAYELLGTPGQWYFDRTSRQIYYVPRSGEDLAKAVVEVPVVETLLAGTGTAERPLQHLVFKGLQFAFATWLFPSGPEGFPEIQANYLVTGTRGSATQGLGALAPGGSEPYGAWTKTPGNIAFAYARGIQFLEDDFIHLGAAGLELGDGSQEDVVEGCIFTDISGNGLELGGVDLPNATAGALTRENRIENNHLYNVGAEFHGGIPIVVGYAQRTLVAHNQIDHIPYAAISIGWGGWPDQVRPSGVVNFSRENVIAENLIFDLMQLLADGGGIYTQGLAGPSLAEGERVMGNVVRDQFGSGHAIYTANGACNVTVAGNVLFHTNHDNWGSRPSNYSHGADGSADDPLLIQGNYWQQGDPDQSAKNVTEAGNHLIASLDQVPAAVLAQAGIEPTYRGLLERRFGAVTPTEAPANVAVVAEDGAADVTWNPPCNDGGAPVTAYAVAASSGEQAVLSADGFRAKGFIRIANLADGRPVSFTVVAINAAGRSAPSLPSAWVTPARPRKRVRVPGAPVRAAVQRAGSIASVHFGAPDSDGGSPVTAYAITVNPGGKRFLLEGRKFLTLAGPHTTFDSLDGLPAAGEMTFAVTALNAAGEGPAAVVKTK